MIVKDALNREAEIKDGHWPLAEELFLKWGYDVSTSEIEVKDVFKITSELSAWGIPWKFL